MALALIDFVEFDKNQVRFVIDTGTNNFYKLKIGKAKTENGGIKWVDDIIHATALKRFDQTTNLLNTNREILLPSSLFNNREIYVQLFSFKSETGKSPAFSRIVAMPHGMFAGKGAEFLSETYSINNQNMLNQPLNDCRYIPADSLQYSYQSGFEDLLGKIIQVATPIISKLLDSNQDSNSGQQGPGSQGAVGLLNTILNSLLNGFGTGQVSQIAKPQSFSENGENANRFLANEEGQFAQPMFAFAALLPLIAAVAPSIIQAVPQLLQAHNDSKLKMRQETNKLNKDIFSDVNKRMMLLQILQNMPQNTPAANTDLNQLMQMIQQMPEASAAAPLATPSSLPMNDMHLAASLSTSTIIQFDLPTVTWNGMEKHLFSHGSDVKLSCKLSVAGNTPKNPLPKSILKVCMKDDKTGKNYFEKTIRQKDIMPNTSIELAFTKDEMMNIPPNTSIKIYGEMRWKTKAGKEIKAFGYSDLVFSSQYFIKEAGKPVSEEREPRDMQVYKSFWNKIWESPVLDAANQRNPDKKKYRWSLDVNGKYFYLLTEKHDSNGVTDTKFLSGEKDAESLTEKTDGRLKSGMELSINELNKLCRLWDKGDVLPQEKLAAFRNEIFASNNSGEFIYNFKLEGSTKERGMFWIVPSFKLFEFSLHKITGTDDRGQITGTEEEKIQFPLPVAARILGLKSE